MPRFAANLSMLFTEVPFLDRFERAAKAGFKAVEFLFPYAFSAEDIQPPARHARARRWCCTTCRPATGTPASAASPACPTASTSSAPAWPRPSSTPPRSACRSSTAWPARRRPGVDEAVLRQTFVANLRYAAAELKKAGLRLLIEPINTFDIPGFYLNRTAQALAILDEVGADNAFVQYDIYHAQRMEGELAATLQKHLARIGHIQLADNPGRNEPGTGEINYPFLFAHLDRIGYARLDRLRIQAGDDHRGGTGLAPATGAIGARRRAAPTLNGRARPASPRRPPSHSRSRRSAPASRARAGGAATAAAGRPPRHR